MMAYPQREKIRLDHANYADTGTVCSVTVCTVNREHLFSNGALADACVELLKTHATDTGIAVYAYCFMPDHLHLLINPSRQTTIFGFLGSFKSLSTRLSWKHGYQGSIWQKRFYDRFLRKDEDVRTVVEYILNNPVRKGIVAERSQYPYCGSLVYEL